MTAPKIKAAKRAWIAQNIETAERAYKEGDAKRLNLELNQMKMVRQSNVCKFKCTLKYLHRKMIIKWAITTGKMARRSGRDKQPVIWTQR